jgi:hypothetical protein
VSLKIYDDLIQGSEDWLEARRGLLTASEVHLILTPTLKAAANDKTHAHVYELAAQRISQYVEPHYIGDDMIRGHQDEASAVYLYSEKIAPVTQVGFITRSFGDFQIGYSPDGLVGDDGLLEVKSRRQKYQIQTIAEFLPASQIAPEYVMQAQTGLLVTGRKWLDHISYCGGLPMAVVRVFPDPTIQDAILNAATAFEAKVAAVIAAFEANSRGLLPTERVIEQELFV